MISTILALTLAATPGAFAPGPHRLTVEWPPGVYTSTLYPSGERCERAKRATERRLDRLARDAWRRARRRGSRAETRWMVMPVCFPL